MNGNRTTLINAAVFFIAPPLAGFAFIVFVRAVLGISEKHVSVLLCQMRRNGLVQRVGIGRYRAVRS